MGKRGPAPTPLKVLKARGSWLGNVNPAAPEGPAGAPRCPGWLDAAGKACWKETVANLAALGLLARTDGKALAGFCERWSFYLRVVKALRAVTGLEDHKTLMTMASAAYRDCIRGCQEFGLSPSARARVQVPGKKAATKGKGRFFKGA